MSLNDVTFKCTADLPSGNKLSYRASDGRFAVTDKGGNGRYAILSEYDRRELALILLGESHDLNYIPGPDGLRHIVAKQKQVGKPEVGEFYRIPGEDGMAEPWCDSPVAKVVTANSPGYVVLETLSGDQTGWSDMRALGEPLDVKVQTEWVVEG
jgi:hypothetical protein